MLGVLVVCAQVALATPIVISEVRQGPAEFVELHNPGAAPVNLRGHRLLGDLVLEFPADLELPAGGRLVLAQAPRAFQREFPDTPFVVGTFHSRLRDQGGELRLYGPDRQLADRVRYGPLVQGQSLQRLDATTAYRGSLNWVHAPPTPARATRSEVTLPGS